jgi:hypothetical protein
VGRRKQKAKKKERGDDNKPHCERVDVQVECKHHLSADPAAEEEKTKKNKVSLCVRTERGERRDRDRQKQRQADTRTHRDR